MPQKHDPYALLNKEIKHAEQVLQLTKFRLGLTKDVLAVLQKRGYDKLGLDEMSADVRFYHPNFPGVIHIVWVAWKVQREPKTGRQLCGCGIGEVTFNHSAERGSIWRWGRSGAYKETVGFEPKEEMRLYCESLASYFQDRGEDRPPKAA